MLDILFQDEHIVAINKPSGLLVHKSWVAKDAKEFALQMVRDQTGKHVFPIHRLDRPTSGVLLFAFNSEISHEVQSNWEHAEKTYWAVVRGWLKEPIFVDHPLKGMADYGQDTTTTQEAQTAFQPIKYAEIDAQIDRYPKSRFSWVEAKPKQGRTHQIRRHLKHLSHPIIGDARYGKSKYNRYIAEHYQCSGLLLHARTLSITHPMTGAPLHIAAPLDNRLSHLFKEFNWQ
ncbi:tRNA pseudouridine(65) synthase TruC [Oceaniserpentilla sp. 4NH20-0058]|uniref:pseudouridine synthase n=1 Tax=Oceaniserpentilla sp. 4NH20-0058 TaxID=3127660 RepID=UPI003102856B